MKTNYASLLIALALALPAANLKAQDGEQPRQPRGQRMQQGGNGGHDGGGQRPPMGQPPGDQQGGQRPVPPLINALDANHDGVIDETEIANASKALKTLDKNGDGKLTGDEIRPVPPQGGGNGNGGPGNGGPNRPPQGQGQRPGGSNPQPPE